MKTIIVEDNMEAAEGLAKELMELPFIDYLGTAHTISEARTLISIQQPELLLMDIEIDADKTTTFDLLQELIEENKLRFEIIFTSAYPSSDYTLRAIKLSCLDFLPKPINKDELFKALNKVIRHREVWKLLENQVLAAQSLYEQPSDSRGTIYVPLFNHSLEKISLHNVLYIESLLDGKFTKIYFVTDSKTINCNHSIGFFRETLTLDQGFFMIHQSRIINLVHLSNFNSTENLVLLNGHADKIQLISSRRHGKLLKDYLIKNAKNKLNEEKQSLLQKLWKKFKRL